MASGNVCWGLTDVNHRCLIQQRRFRRGESNVRVFLLPFAGTFVQTLVHVAAHMVINMGPQRYHRGCLPNDAGDCEELRSFCAEAFWLRCVNTDQVGKGPLNKRIHPRLLCYWPSIGIHLMQHASLLETRTSTLQAIAPGRAHKKLSQSAATRVACGSRKTKAPTIAGVFDGEGVS